MKSSYSNSIRAVILLATATLVSSPLFAQEPGGDAIRINSDLVQTDVMVFDKKGRFVDGLTADQFMLTLDGKPLPISFFDQFRSGSAREAKLVVRSTPSTTAGPVAKTSDPGRVVLFFVDDVHLSNESLIRTRKALTDYVDQRRGQNDLVAVVSTSGQIGFLQQLTDNDAVLHEAIARLNYKRNPETYSGRTVITEYQANQIAEHGDKDLMNYIISSTINEFQLLPPKGGDPRGLDRLAVNNVKNRVNQINAQSKATAADTLMVLMSLMRSSAKLPGRKLLFFLSDGFIADSRDREMNMLKRVTAVAAEVGIAVYSLDASGLRGDPNVDAGRNDFPDGLASGTMARQPETETVAMREPLQIMADDTGGRALFNSNSMPDSFQQALNETSAYYLLAWRPDTDDQLAGRAQLKVLVKDRPDLKVRLRRNYYVPPPRTAENTPVKNAPPAPNPEAELVKALGSLYPPQTLPLSLSAGYQKTPGQNAVLKVSMQLERSAFFFDPATGPANQQVDVIGAAIDDRGVIVTFKQVLTLTPEVQNQTNEPIKWSQQLSVPPGLYQVRVAVRERESGRLGGAQQWIEVPATAGLQMSSLFLAERNPAPTSTPQPLPVNIDHHFRRASNLRYQTYLYGAVPGSEIEIHAQVLRDGQLVAELPPAKVPNATSADHSSQPYWAELSLANLAPGGYLLQVTATDRSGKASAVQRVRFVVE